MQVYQIMTSHPLDVAIGEGGVGFDSHAGQVGHSFKGLPLLRSCN